MRLIDADAIKIKPVYMHDICGVVMIRVEDIARILNDMPSVQPEIIRCKECKHWFDIDDGRQKHGMCADVYGDWFCADAERKEGEADD